jgi:hypothetical protein
MRPQRDYFGIQKIFVYHFNNIIQLMPLLAKRALPLGFSESGFARIIFSTMRATVTATGHSLFATYASFEIDLDVSVTHLCCVGFVLQEHQRARTHARAHTQDGR